MVPVGYVVAGNGSFSSPDASVIPNPANVTKNDGLSAKAKERLEELIAEIDLPLREKTRTVSGVLKKDRSPDDPVPGTLFTRVWKGQEIRVLVREDG